eukprot:2227678-Prymnesium_polylepis.1
MAELDAALTKQLHAFYANSDTAAARMALVAPLDIPLAADCDDDDLLISEAQAAGLKLFPQEQTGVYTFDAVGSDSCYFSVFCGPFPGVYYESWLDVEPYVRLGGNGAYDCFYTEQKSLEHLPYLIVLPAVVLPAVLPA